MNQGFAHIFKRIFFSTMAKNVLFLGSEKIVFYRYASGLGAFQIANEKQGASKAGFPKNAVLVVGREFYFEINHTFPIIVSRDLVKAVVLEAPSLAPRDYCRYVFSSHRESQQSRVNLWFFKPELKDWIDRLKPMILLPESALAGLSQSGNAVALYYGMRRDHFIFCFKKRQGDLLSRLVPKGRGAKESLAEFKRLAGHEASDAEAIFLGASTGVLDSGEEVRDYYSALAERLQTFPLGRWFRFLCRERFRPTRIGRPISYLMSVVLVFFFLFPMGFSYWHAASVNKELISREKQISQKAGVYLAMREEVENKAALLEKLQVTLIEYVPRTLILSEVGRLLKPPGDTLTSLRLVGENLEIRGNTQSSSSLMAQVGKSGFFKDVRLSSPVVKDRKTGKERFVIEITVTKPATKSENG